jgi:hypothetical protein
MFARIYFMPSVGVLGGLLSLAFALPANAQCCSSGSCANAGSRPRSYGEGGASDKPLPNLTVGGYSVR